MAYNKRLKKYIKFSILFSYAYYSLLRNFAYCNQEEFVSSGVKSYIHVCLHKWNKFALCRLLIFDEFSPDSALDN